MHVKTQPMPKILCVIHTVISAQLQGHALVVESFSSLFILPASYPLEPLCLLQSCNQPHMVTLHLHTTSNPTHPWNLFTHPPPPGAPPPQNPACPHSQGPKPPNAS